MINCSLSLVLWLAWLGIVTSKPSFVFILTDDQDW